VSLLDLQRTLSRILTDHAFRTAFQADPASATAAYALDPTELASLTALSWQRVGAQAEMVAHNRLGLALKAFPLSAPLLYERMHARLDEFCAAYPPAPVRDNPMLAEAGRLLEFALPLLAADRLGPRWVADLLRYEFAATRLSVSAAAQASAVRTAALSADVGFGRGFNSRAATAVTGPHATVLAFDHDMVDLVARLEAGTVPDPVRLARPPQRVLFVKLPDAPTVQRFAVNAPTAALIGMADGRTTVDRLLDRLTALTGRSRAVVEPAALQTLDRLRHLGVVAVQPVGRD
jgi:hypothetical protein